MDLLLVAAEAEFAQQQQRLGSRPTPARLRHSLVTLGAKKLELATLSVTQADVLKVQADVRAVRAAGAGVPRVHHDLAAVLLCVRARVVAFYSQLALNTRGEPGLRRSEARRKITSANRRTANQIVSFAEECQLARGPLFSSRPPIIFRGDSGPPGKGISFDKVWKEVAKKCLVLYTDEFRSSCNDIMCGGVVHTATVSKARPGHTATPLRCSLQCSDRNCPSKGRFQHRDLMAACNIACLWVYRMLLGGYLGGYSRCEALNGDKTQLVDMTQRLSLFRLFHGA